MEERVNELLKELQEEREKGKKLSNVIARMLEEKGIYVYKFNFFKNYIDYFL